VAAFAPVKAAAFGELSATVVHLLAHLSARPTEAFMSLSRIARGLL